MIEFDRGQLFMKDLNNNNYIKLADGIPYMEDIPLSPYEDQEVSFLLCPKKTKEIEFTVDALDAMNLELLNNMSHISTPNKFTLKYNKPIMIQVRWHKKHRINKKWLKRYGVKPDTVEVLCDAKTCDYDTYDGSFDIDASNFQYNLKPHQKRRNLKIEW